MPLGIWPQVNGSLASNASVVVHVSTGNGYFNLIDEVIYDIIITSLDLFLFNIMQLPTSAVHTPGQLNSTDYYY